MQTLLNFAHPLGEKAKKQIEDEVGEGINEIIIPCQLDFSKGLSAQINDIETLAEKRLMEADFVIAPAFAAGAYLLAAGRLAPGPNNRPRLVWLKKEGVPPEFILGGIE